MNTVFTFYFILNLKKLVSQKAVFLIVAKVYERFRPVRGIWYDNKAK